MSALTIASFIGMSTRSLPYARSAASVDTRRPRKLLKTVWYFPITPRLQRYFTDPKQAKIMRWHAERKQQKEEAEKNDPDKDIMLSHPSDGTQWEALNFEEDFGKDPRNVVLVASTDGVNPLGNQSSTHSTWPVFVCMYNIPPGSA